MRSRVAEETRRAQAAREAAMSPAERQKVLEQANALSIELFASANGVTRREAEAILRKQPAAERKAEWTRKNSNRL